MPATGPTWDSLPMSTRTTEQIVDGLVDLVVGVGSSAELTAESVGRAFGLDLQQYDNGDVGSYGLLTPTRSFALRLHADQAGIPHLRLSFHYKNNDSASEPPAAEMSLDRFARRLEESGFDHRTQWGEHGRRLGEDFTRGHLKLQVMLTGHPVDGGEQRLTIRSVNVG